jgi:hypothetical protein
VKNSDKININNDLLASDRTGIVFQNAPGACDVFSPHILQNIKKYYLC